MAAVSDEFWEGQKEGAAKKLRTYLLRAGGDDYGLSDEHLQAVAEAQMERVRRSGRRWSWVVFAAAEVRRAQEGAS